MDTSRIEALLEQLIDKQDQLILRIENLETTIENKLDEVNSSVSDLENAALLIHNELNWWGEDHSLAKQLVKSLNDIESNLMSIDLSISMKD